MMKQTTTIQPNKKENKMATTMDPEAFDEILPRTRKLFKEFFCDEDKQKEFFSLAVNGECEKAYALAFAFTIKGLSEIKQIHLDSQTIADLTKKHYEKMPAENHEKLYTTGDPVQAITWPVANAMEAFIQIMEKETK